MTSDTPLNLVWMRRDLRLHDHAALSSALSHQGVVQPVFVFDTDILKDFPDKQDRRLTFIARAIDLLHSEIKSRSRGSGMLVLHGSAKELIPKLASVLNVSRISAAEDFEPGTIKRDKQVQTALEKAGVSFELLLDHVMVHPGEVLTQSDEPYKVFTPYSKAWRGYVHAASAAEYDIDDANRYASLSDLQSKLKQSGINVIDADKGIKHMLEEIGYEYTHDTLWHPDKAQDKLDDFIKQYVNDYKVRRDRLASAEESGTSHLSPYLRFGILSIRELYRAAIDRKNSFTWITELIWREFYHMILYHYPESVEKEWNETYRSLSWDGSEAHFNAWQEGRTGYPVVDAAMCQLKEEGWMHNRARMIVASFLTKDLHVDWRKGEAHFAQYLMDYELSSNVGGWQWAASTGTDAQPYFRIFNPKLQSEKFDPNGDYIRRFVPELKDIKGKEIHALNQMESMLKNYPDPIVDHSKERNVALAAFKAAKG